MHTDEGGYGRLDQLREAAENAVNLKYNDNDVRRVAKSIPNYKVIQSTRQVLNIMTNELIPYEIFMSKHFRTWLDLIRDLARTTPGYQLDKSQLYVKDLESGAVLTLFQFKAVLEQRKPTPQPPRGGQLKDPANYIENKSDEEASGTAFVSDRWSHENIRQLAAKTVDWVASSDPNFQFVMNRSTKQVVDSKIWMSEQMREGNFGWEEQVRELAAENGYDVNVYSKTVYKVPTGENYSYKDFLQVQKWQRQRETEGREFEVERAQVQESEVASPRKKFKKQREYSSKKSKPERVRSYVDYVDLDNNDSILVEAIKKPIEVYSRETDFGYGKVHQCLENESECKVISQVVHKLENGDPFRTLFGK
jgi:hypothetical protein